MGVDGCGFTVASAQAFWTKTPYYNFGLYVGGVQAACPYTSSFASSLRSQGWRFMPLWVGPQSPCWGYGGPEFSLDPATAFSQGESEEASAYKTLQGFGWNMNNAPVIDDLEAYDTTSQSCVTAAQYFVSGWATQAKVGTPQIDGVYGSTCASDLTALGLHSPNPDFIDGASWDGVMSTASMPCVPSMFWASHQRFKQYAGTHNETWNGYTVTVDSDCSNAPTYPDGVQISQGCV